MSLDEDFCHVSVESCFDQSFALSTEAVDALCVEALETTAKLLLGPGEPSYPTRLLDFDVLQVLAMQGRLQATMERDTGLDHARPQLVRQCVLLGIMLLTLELPRSPDIGISFGDLIRTNVQRVAKQIEIIDALRGDEACFDPAWWLEQSLQYTDTF
ncbi:protein of unknown function [Taphrina deformans PYCC 5710]|uniref:Uncharacterized protein n=1 Tax=Taphrina deformans (strain PYCC 5710 / ATCC 11124 / CBS 356.35 / IMI 108563 / JCM 9778 / NBRC 8474) TaxID=1097556 RepID=R4XHC2_TAPDE|nr:protein of unknown function [Taphrina deformans PYCC 5710]|eukprot:CCG85088.1 protein of unknown function [Taphrina deformans PYCC 5710]